MTSANADVTAAAGEIPPHFELLRDESGFGRLIGPLYVRKPGDGRAFAWGFRAVDKHLNPGGVVHGGMLMTFADQCFGGLVFFAAGKKPCSTIDLSASFVSPGRAGDWIECTGTVSRVTRDLVFVTGRVTAAERTLVDLKGIWKLLDRWLGAPKTG
ncbi:MAG: PaaI family thioesterase [Alphaproteobacteria bacterium]|nr:PaaI family thioesterase [Alphaproteobacteria bacterium]